MNLGAHICQEWAGISLVYSISHHAKSMNYVQEILLNKLFSSEYIYFINNAVHMLYSVEFFNKFELVFMYQAFLI